ncbi:MORN repeat-containing protein 1-like [Scyliorhinus canicula]|uniref:MORN repeat-containing protein 1-like n=1 Tax=Scyliorhinus canicula TaxID=7830 RepID=UPI0018F787DA|nr:MORN repeat-containing protein 1-like [Scyliorhinus canicula]
MEVPAAADRYVGEVKQQMRDGFGLYVYPNSFFQYEGEWKKGKKHGIGKFLMKDGSYYEGEFLNGEIEGNGVRYWAASGNEYCGQFSQGEIHGYGVMKYFNGARYEGEFHYGARTGHGAMIDNEGQVYRGSFHSNKRQGEGELFYQNGDHYQGDWVLDRRQGHGILQYADSSYYEGQWRNDLFNGQGSMIHCSGVTYDGMWINGHPATEATKLVILGEGIQEVVQGSPFTIEVQLQNNEGKLAKAESGRVLQIWAGVKHIKLSPTGSDTFLEMVDLEESLFETPFGFDAIRYPLMEYVPDPDKVKWNSAASSRSEITMVGSLGNRDSDVNKSKLDLVAATGKPQDSLLDTPDPSPVNKERGTNQQEEALYGSQLFLAVEKASIPTLANQRAESGSAVFWNIALAEPPASYRPFMILDELEKKTIKKLSSRALSDRTTVSQEKISESRSETSVKLGGKSKKVQNATDLQTVRLGEYVIMVQDVTAPPFLGRTLSPAFVLLKVIPQKPNRKGSRKELHKVPNK